MGFGDFDKFVVGGIVVIDDEVEMCCLVVVGVDFVMIIYIFGLIGRFKGCVLMYFNFVELCCNVVFVMGLVVELGLFILLFIMIVYVFVCFILIFGVYIGVKVGY